MQNYERARQLFHQELQHQPHQAEVHHWAALAHRHLGNQRAVAHHLAQAGDFSGTRPERDRYSTKPESLRAALH